MSRIIFSIGLLFELIMVDHVYRFMLTILVGKREETTFKKLLRYLNEFVMFVRSYQKDLYVLKKMIVLSLIGTITIIVLLNRLIKGRNRTQRNDWPAKDCASTNQGSLAEGQYKKYLASRIQPADMCTRSYNDEAAK